MVNQYNMRACQVEKAAKFEFFEALKCWKGNLTTTTQKVDKYEQFFRVGVHTYAACTNSLSDIRTVVLIL